MNHIFNFDYSGLRFSIFSSLIQYSTYIYCNASSWGLGFRLTQIYQIFDIRRLRIRQTIWWIQSYDHKKCDRVSLLSRPDNFFTWSSVVIVVNASPGSVRAQHPVTPHRLHPDWRESGSASFQMLVRLTMLKTIKRDILLKHNLYLYMRPDKNLNVSHEHFLG